MVEKVAFCKGCHAMNDVCLCPPKANRVKLDADGGAYKAGGGFTPEGQKAQTVLGDHTIILAATPSEDQLGAVLGIGRSYTGLGEKPHQSSTLPTDSQERKEVPLMSGLLNYFPAALAGVARISKKNNSKHNPGQPLHHARGKSMDHGDCILRHLMDLQEQLAAYDRSAASKMFALEPISLAILEEAGSLAWRALALSQELHERFGAPLAPGAKE